MTATSPRESNSSPTLYLYVADCLIHFAGMECHAFMAADLADRSPEAVAEALLSESDRRMGTEIHAVKPHGGSRETGVQRGACGWTLESGAGHGAAISDLTDRP